MKEPRIGNCTACSYQMDYENSVICSGCRKPVCDVCCAQGQCPPCCYSLPAERKVDFGDACAIQKGEELPIRKGTSKLLKAGARRVRVLAEHNIRPKFVQRVIKQETAREAEVLTAKAQNKPTVKKTHLIEYCCGPESLPMQNWKQQGGKGTRVCFHNWTLPNLT